MADARVASARPELGLVGLEVLEDAGGIANRAAAAPGIGEVARAALHVDLGDVEARLGGVDVDARRLDVHGEVGARHAPGRDRLHEGAHAGASTHPFLAAFLVADEGDEDVASGLGVRGRQRLERCEDRRDAALLVGRAEPPERGVDERPGEGIGARVVAPNLRPATDGDRVGVPEEQHGRAVPSTAVSVDVRPPRRELLDDTGHGEAVEQLGEHGGETAFVAGDRLHADEPAHELDDAVG